MLAYLCELSRARARAETIGKSLTRRDAAKLSNAAIAFAAASYSRHFSFFLFFFSLSFAVLRGVSWCAASGISTRWMCTEFQADFTRTSFWDYSVVMVLFGVCRALVSAEGKIGKFRDEDPLSGIINLDTVDFYDFFLENWATLKHWK